MAINEGFFCVKESKRFFSHPSFSFICHMDIPQKATRRFLPHNLVINTFDDIEIYLKELCGRNVQGPQDFYFFLLDLSELEAVLEEEGAWRYIKMSINTADEELAKSYNYFITEIAPKLAPYENTLNTMVHESPYKDKLKEGEDYQVYFKMVAKDIELFRDENIKIDAELGSLAQEYGAIVGAMEIEHDGQIYTMPQTAKFFKNQDRVLREAIFNKVQTRRLQDANKLEELFSTMVQKRNQVALNAGFDNYRDYMFKALGRFDYGVKDCKDFHQSVKEHIVPLVDTFMKERKKALGIDVLRPWDLSVEPDGKKPLEPFKDGKELCDKSISVFNKLDPYFGDCLATMDKMGHLDLESKKGKAPGGYNYPLYEIGVPFIFMNASGQHSDMTTMMHEGGHAVHSFLSKDLRLTGFKNLSSEIAELASMSMELISMDHWDEFYTDEELIRAKKDQLFDAISVLPWVACVDKFQHWLYENPLHTADERTAAWLSIHDEFRSTEISWEGLEDVRAKLWHKQLHIFEVPFYYIEYGFAQLGALAVWKNYKANPKKGLAAYKKALSLGYTKSILEVYEAANIKFNFSSNYIKALRGFVEEELAKIE